MLAFCVLRSAFCGLRSWLRRCWAGENLSSRSLDVDCAKDVPRKGRDAALALNYVAVSSPSSARSVANTTATNWPTPEAPHVTSAVQPSNLLIMGGSLFTLLPLCGATVYGAAGPHRIVDFALDTLNTTSPVVGFRVVH